ncbi:MAG: tetratricopeptide repeat protein [Oscillospiraceae bacterium]|jgi:tetratricopeptide (TPR) repeat protein|nr:tetratricopeptide repeat protein [Oscillospiraceae bacterium]
MENIDVQEYLTQGAVLSGQGQYEAALEYYRKAEKADPMDPEVYLAQGTALASLDRLEEAKTQFEKALKVDRTCGLAYFHLGSIAILQGDVAKGFEDYNKAVSNGYDDAQLYYSMGLLHEEIGEMDLAIRSYSKAALRDPTRPDVRLRKAQLLQQCERIPEALQALDEMILACPDYFEGYHMKCVILTQQRRWAEAEKLLADALALFPEDPGFALDKASLLVERGRTEEGLALLDELEHREKTDDPVRRRIYMERARIHASANQLDEAITALNQAKALSEKEGVFDQQAVFLLANCCLSKGSYEQVLDCALQLREKGEDVYILETARYFQPLALKMMGRMEEALPLYQEAVSAYRQQSLDMPGNLDAYLLRIMCLRDMEQYEKALELTDYVLQLKPDRAEPRMLRISVLEAMGRTEEAQTEANALQELLPPELRK